MRAVLDASVLVASLLRTHKEGPWVRSIVATHQQAAPELVLVEACNVLRRLEQARSVSHFEATLGFRTLLRFDLKLSQFAPFAQRIWMLRANLTSHDVWYVAVAEELDCALCTFDRRLSRAPGRFCEIITPSSEVPELVAHQSADGTGNQSLIPGHLFS